MAERFAEYEGQALIPLKGMLKNAKPGNLKTAADHWGKASADLESAAQELQAALDHARANWDGAASDGFAKKAAEIQASLNNTAQHAAKTSSAMHLASDALKAAQSTMGSISVPSSFESGVKFIGDLGDRSDAQFKADLAGGMDRFAAVNKNYDELSATEIQHQYAIGTMEYLAPYYQQAAAEMPEPPKQAWQTGTAFPPPPDDPGGKGSIPPVSPPPPMLPPKLPPQQTNPPGFVPGHQPTVPTPGVPQPTDPGQHKETIYPGIDPVRPVTPPSTGLDGWKPPETGGGLPGVPGGGLPGGVGTLPGPGTGGGGIGGGGIGGGGIVPGIGGGGYIPGGGSGGGRTGGLGTGGLGTGGGSGTGKAGGAGGVGGAGKVGGAGAGGAGTGAGAAGGRGATGAGGMGGMHGGGMGGAGGAKGGGAKGGSGLVRKAGGTIGGAKAGGAGGRAFTEGGSGIGKGRGAGQGGAAGMHGAPGSGGANRKKKNEGHRPDYLTEDEETWRGGTANPPVIE